MNQPDLKTFVERYFASIGAAGHSDVPGVVHYEMPPERRSGLNASSLEVTLDPALVERYDGVELLISGSLLLDRILDDASTRGHHCVAKAEASGAPPPAEVLAANLKLRNVSADIVSTENPDLPYFLFIFRLTMVTDEKTEFLDQVLVSSRSLSEHPVRELFLDESLALPEEPIEKQGRLLEAYYAACGFFEKNVAPAVSACRDSAKRRLEEETNRIKEYFSGLMREAQESKYPQQAAAAVKAYEAEEEKRLEEARLKYSLDAKVKLVSVRTILVPTVLLTARLTAPGTSKDVKLEYDEIGLEIPPLKCEACSTEMVDVGLCGEGHLVCSKCERVCVVCRRVSCPVCGEASKISKQCTECGRPLCDVHAVKDEFGLGSYCPDHILACPSCGRNASAAFVARCRRCNQKYCFQCVAARGEKVCATCRAMESAGAGDKDVSLVISQSAHAARFSKWRKAANRRFKIVEGKSLLARRTFVLDEKGVLVYEG